MKSEKLSDLLVIFSAVVDASSFSAASRELKMSPAWVAKQVSRLETYLDADLLIRSTRSMRLTDAGEECYRTAGKVSEELAALKDRLNTNSKMVSGSVRVNVPSIVAVDLLAPHIASFQNKYPKLKLDVVVSERFVDILNEDIDFVFRVARALSDSTAIVQRLADMPRILCASESYLQSAPNIASLQDLKSHKALMFSGLQNPESWALRHLHFEELIVPNVVMQANNSFLLKRAAIDGAGVAFLPQVIVERELRTGQLIHLTQFEDAAPFSLFLLRAPQKHLPIRVQVTWRFFAEMLSSQ